jgi:hypothetical protein
MNFDTLWNAFSWSAIPRCPGRFVATQEAGTGPLAAVLAAGIAVTEHRTAVARDAVLVAAFGDGGLICYRRADGTYRHTLNTPEGLHRKLVQLGIVS